MQKNENTNMIGLLGLLKGLLILLDVIFVFIFIMMIPGVSGEHVKPEQTIISALLVVVFTVIVVILHLVIKKKRKNVTLLKEQNEIPVLPFIIKSKNFNPVYNVMITLMILVSVGGIPLAVFQSVYFLIQTGLAAVFAYFLYKEKLKLDFKLVFTVDAITEITGLKETSIPAELITKIQLTNEMIHVKSVHVAFKNIVITASDNKKLVIDGRRVIYPIDLLYQAVKKYYQTQD